MHPYKRTSSKHHDEALRTKVKLSVLPVIQNTQLKCQLINGTTHTQYVAPVVPEQKGQSKILPVVVIVKCPCCTKIISKETVFMTEQEESLYFHSFVERSIPGIVKYEICNKCKGVELKIV